MSDVLDVSSAEQVDPIIVPSCIGDVSDTGVLDLPQPDLSATEADVVFPKRVLCYNGQDAEEMLRGLGFVFLGDVSGTKHLRRAQLPAGWRLNGSCREGWFALHDEREQLRAGICLLGSNPRASFPNSAPTQGPEQRSGTVS